MTDGKGRLQTFCATGVEVRVSETVELNLAMQAGEVSEAIEIAAATPLLDTAGASLGQVIDERRVQECPFLPAIRWN